MLRDDLVPTQVIYTPKVRPHLIIENKGSMFVLGHRGHDDKKGKKYLAITDLDAFFDKEYERVEVGYDGWPYLVLNGFSKEGFVKISYYKIKEPGGFSDYRYKSFESFCINDHGNLQLNFSRLGWVTMIFGFLFQFSVASWCLVGIWIGNEKTKVE
ncbi:MAG: hypothetical protein AAB611_01995 [Patescibacteria group bacterium]